MQKTCRVCKSDKRIHTLKLGKLPISNSLLKNDKDKTYKFPLNLFVCKNCYLAQLEDFVPKKKIFNSDYKYFSSYSKQWVNHSKKLVNKIIKKFKLNQKNSLVTELASNDGYLLENFVKKKIKCFGVEPSLSVAKISKEKRIQTFIKFFNEQTAKFLVKKKLSADVVIALNVVGHVPDLLSFIKGVKILLKKNGVFILEIPYFINLIKNKQFDTIYHEHYSYFSIISMNYVLNKYQLYINEIELLETHGGSLRYYISNNNTNYVEKINILKEEKIFLNNKNNYIKFSKRLHKIRVNIKNFLSKIKKKNKKIIGYGAAAKTTILTNYCNIKKKDISYIVDKNKYKINNYIPGSMLKIKSENSIKKDKPEIIIIFIWNLAKEILKQLKYTKKWNSKIYTLYPKIKKISK